MKKEYYIYINCLYKKQRNGKSLKKEKLNLKNSFFCERRKFFINKKKVNK